MTRATLDTGSNGIQLQLEYGTLVDAATGGAITADTASVKFSNLEAWLDTNGYHTVDSSNSLRSYGSWVADDSWSNISIDTSGSKKLKELSPSSQALAFGAEGSNFGVSLEMTGVNAAGTLQGTKYWVVPRRPYHGPYAPGVTIAENVMYITGHQLNAALDRYWSRLRYAVETNDVWGGDGVVPNNYGAIGFVMAPNCRYRAAAAADNDDAIGTSGISGYYYSKPNTPTLAANRPIGSTQVTLTLGNTAPYAAALLIERALDTGGWAQIGSTGSGTFTDTVPLNSIASYRIRVQSLAGVNVAYSDYSAAAAIGLGYTIPGYPGLQINRSSETTGIVTVSGHQSNPALDKYWASLEWLVQLDEGAYGGGATGLAGTTTSIPFVIAANHRYSVRVRAVNATGPGPWSQTIYLFTTPAAPTEFTAARAGLASTQVDLAWANPAPYANLFIVERSTNGGTSWTQLGTSATTSYSDTLPVGSSALYRVKAQAPNQLLQSAYSDTAVVPLALISDKAKIPGLVRCYVGEDRIRKMQLGTSVLWVDGDE